MKHESELHKQKEKKLKLSFSTKLYLCIVFTVLIILLLLKLLAQEAPQEKPKEQFEIVEEDLGSGFLGIETSPSGADIFMDNIYSGKSPLTLNDVPAGLHKIIIKKGGYEDFMGDVEIKAGRKTSIEANLALIQIFQEKTETEEVFEEVEKEETSTATLSSNGVVNVGKDFLIYYDLSEWKLTDKKQVDSDIFSKRYDKHFVFTRFNLVNIKTIDKGINKVKKEDCVGIKGSFEFLNSGQSLCVVSKDGSVIAIGGEWDVTENAKLTWKLFS